MQRANKTQLTAIKNLQAQNRQLKATNAALIGAARALPKSYRTLFICYLTGWRVAKSLKTRPKARATRGNKK